MFGKQNPGNGVYSDDSIAYDGVVATADPYAAVNGNTSTYA